MRRLIRYAAVLLLAVVALIAAALAATQTGWFKNYLRGVVVRQAGQYLNGTFAVERLGGSILTGIELDGMTLSQDGRTAIAIGRLTLRYNPLTMMSRGLIFSALVLDRPTILLERDERGWNFNRFVKTRQNTGGGGAPPITIETLDINDGHLVVRDRGTLVEDLAALEAKLRFAYLKPGIALDVAELTGRSPDTNIRRFRVNFRMAEGAMRADDVSVLTDRSDFSAAVVWSGEPARTLDASLHAARLSLPEIGRFFKPIAGIDLEPAVDVTAHGPLDRLEMDVKIVSADGNAQGPLVGHFGEAGGLQGALDVQAIDLRRMLNRPEWATKITGRAEFDWTFGRTTAAGDGPPMNVRFSFAGPEVEGFGYRATDVKAQGVYEAPDLRFDASGIGYGASATARGAFHFPASEPMSYTLAGNFRNLDMRRLPSSLDMPKLATAAAGEYRFESTGADWQAQSTLDDSTVEGARFVAGTLVQVGSTARTLRYSAEGTVEGLDPYRFAAPLDVKWLNDERLRGQLTGRFTFAGSGTTMDRLTLETTADLTGSTLAGAEIPQAHVAMRMSERRMTSTFAGGFARVPGSLFSTNPSLAESTLNGTADLNISLDIPAEGPVRLLEAGGTAALDPSTLAGFDIDKARFDGVYANDTAEIRAFTLTGPRVEATATGSFAFGDEGRSDARYEIAITDLAPLAKLLDRPLSGGAHVVGTAAGPASQVVLSGTLDANRLEYGTTADALTAVGTYSVALPDWDVEQARIDADTTATFVTIGNMSLPRVTAKTSYAAKELTFDTSFEEETRTLGLEGRLLLHPDHNEVHLRTLNLSVGETTWALPPGQEAAARYTADSLTLDDFVLVRGDQRLTASGTLAIGDASDRRPNDLDVRLDNVSIRDINEMLLGERPLDGVLDATAEIRGTRADPVVASSFSLTNGSVEGVAFESLTGKADYAGRVVTLDARLQENPAAFLTATGRVPIPNGPGERSAGDTFDLTVASSPIDLALFQAATTQVTNLSGRMLMNVHVTGTLEEPSLDGQLEVTDAGFTAEATGVTYRNLLARMTFEKERAIIDRFEIVDNESSRLVAIGELGIVRRNVGTMNFQVSATDFKVLDNEFGRVVVDSDLRISGDARRPLVSGTLSTPSGRLEVDQLLEQLTKNPYRTEAIAGAVPEAPAGTLGTAGTTGTAGAAGTPGTPAAAAFQAPAAQQPAADTSSIFDNATIDIHVSMPDDLVLRGRNLQTAYSRIGLGNTNITVGGDLDIRKQPGGEPEIVGTVTVIRGFYEFQGRRFEVLRDSQIRFQGVQPVDPALQVNAQRVISGVTAVVNIRGTMRQPSVSLTSTPPMDEADVLSLIVFNQPINQLGESERLNLAQRAGSMAAGYIATPLANSIADALGLDLFEIRPEGGVNGQPTVALGQQFGSRLFVQFRQGFGPSESSELSLEYRISEFLRLVSTVAQVSQQTRRAQRLDTTGADLIYVISY